MLAPSPQRSRRTRDHGAVSLEPARRREYGKWTPAEEETFFQALKSAGRADLTRIATAIPTKTRDQIKRYYHRLLRKINVLLAPAIEAINLLDADDVRLSLLSWWSMQQKLGRDASAAAIQSQNARGGAADSPPDSTPGRAGATAGPLSATFVRGLRSLVVTNRKRLETRRAEVERALGRRGAVPDTTLPPHGQPAAPAKTAAASVAPPSGGMHRLVSPVGQVSPKGGGGGVVEAPPAGHMTLQLLPVDDVTQGAVERAGFNPLLELTFRTRKSLGSVLQHVRTKWAAVPQALGMGPGAELRLLPREAVRINALAGWGDECGFQAAGEVLRPGPAGSCDGAVVEVKYGWLAAGVAVPVHDAVHPSPAVKQQHTPSVGAAAQHHGAWGQAAATPQGGGHSGGKRPPRESMLSLLLGPTPDSRDHRPGALAGHGSAAAAAATTHGPPRHGGATPMTPEYAHGMQPLGEAHPGLTAGGQLAARPPWSVAWQQQIHAQQAGDMSILPPFAEEESLTVLAQRWMCQSAAPQQPQQQPRGMQQRFYHGDASGGGGGSLIPDLLGNNGSLGFDEMELLRDMSTRRPAALLPPRGDASAGGGGGAARSLQVVPAGGDGAGLLGLGAHDLTNDVFACLNSMPFQLGAEPSWLAPDQAGVGAAGGPEVQEPVSFRGIMSSLHRA